MSSRRPIRRRSRGRLVGLIVAIAVITTGTPFAAATAPLPGGVPVGTGGAPGPGLTSAATSAPAAPVYAYFYQWFAPSSWQRAKSDLPLIGGYSSDDPHVLRDQVVLAKTAGITGFLTSWKSTPALNRRLSLLIKIARSEHLDVGVVYEALDFTRKPLPVATVEHDMAYLVDHWATGLRSSYFGRPVVIWTGTDEYSVAAVRAVRKVLGGRALLLSASKSVVGYERVADVVNGEAYYWSSADPKKPGTAAKLRAMGAAVHEHHGIWIAPAAGGFDGRSLNHTRVIPRDGGATLVRSLDAAYASAPSAVGVISWNEWSENTYIEPGKRYGYEELNTLRNYLRRPLPLKPVAMQSEDPPVDWSGLMAVVTLGVLTCLGVALMTWLARRRARNQHMVRL
jgi:hypothetical protein